MKVHGGPAFPAASTARSNMANTATWSIDTLGGMTMRDYFAARALESLPDALNSVVVGVHNDKVMGAGSTYAAQQADTIAQAAYLVADAMLAEREK